MALLILNAGSSSLKYSFIDPASERVWAEGEVESASGSGFESAVRRIVSDVRSIEHAEAPSVPVEAVVHRVVHGGARFTGPVVVTADVRAVLTELTALAPLHNPPSLAVMDLALEALPDVTHVAVFDTAFHATLAPEAFTYPVPFEWTTRWGLRRFGFHGFSHAYCARRALELAGAACSRIVVAHLGNGASVTAVRDGVSVDTSMGFTPLEGLMMGTRSGSVDPGLLLHLLLERGVSVEALREALNHESGLLGVSGVSSDMRRVADASRAGDQRSSLAIRIFAHRARQAIGAVAVTMGGVDALVFTAGIGEHSAEVRRHICAGLSCLGLELDDALNGSMHPDAIVSAPGSRGQILVLRTREDLTMARAAMSLLRTDHTAL